MSEISVSQSHLSEELQLLTEFGYSDLDMPYQSVGVRSNKDIREPETHSDMRVLEVIATCLTTGRPGDVVAAAFDKRRNIRLLLAKNGDVGSTDFPAIGWGDASTHAFTPNFALFFTLVHRCYQNPLDSFHCKPRNSYQLVAASAAAFFVSCG